MTRRLLLHTLFCLTGIGATCAPRQEISEARAIAIARQHATFEVVSADARRDTDSGRAVWRVTLRGKPASTQLPELYPSLIVLINRRSGEIVSLAQS